MMGRLGRLMGRLGRVRNYTEIVGTIGPIHQQIQNQACSLPTLPDTVPELGKGEVVTGEHAAACFLDVVSEPLVSGLRYHLRCIASGTLNDGNGPRAHVHRCEGMWWRE